MTDLTTQLHATKDTRLFQIIQTSWTSHAKTELERRAYLRSSLDETIESDLFNAMPRLDAAGQITINRNLVAYNKIGLIHEGWQMTLDILYSARLPVLEP